MACKHSLLSKVLVYLFWLCLSKIKIDEYVVIFVSIKTHEQTVQETLVVMFSCSLLFLPIFSIKITIHILWWALISRFLSFFVLFCVGIFCVSYLSLYHHLFIYHSQTTTNITQHMFVVNASSECCRHFPEEFNY